MIILCSNYSHKLLKSHLKKESKILYIPTFNNSTTLKEYRDFKRNLTVNVDYLIWDKMPKSFKEYDVVFLAGGNTFDLMLNIRKYGLKRRLKALLKQSNVVIIAESAGALSLSPSIKLALIPSHSADELPSKPIINYKGMGILSFEISAHYDIEDKQEVDKYEKSIKYPVLRLDDNQYSIVNSKTVFPKIRSI